MKTTIVIVMLMVAFCSCSKQHEMKCIECTDAKTPSNYIPTYCADKESADAYLSYMTSKKIGGKQLYDCKEKEIGK